MLIPIYSLFALAVTPLLTVGATATLPGALQLSSPAFAPQAEIPPRYTCESAVKPEPSPPLTWSGVPASAKSLVLIVDDPDAPQATWTHWMLYDLPAASRGLAEAMTSSVLPVGTREGMNDWERTGYGGPCPPSGRHRYFFKLYALDLVLPDLHGPSPSQLEAAIKGHVLAQGQLIGTYLQRGH
jgi:Raf kinase inhibitor-like YbhB/YbcL family protein